MSNNMTIWEAVNKTDPRHTKKVAQRGGFTSIDAMYQVMRATEQFGPVGMGWGYNCTHSTLDTGPAGVLAFCDVSLWWIDGEREAKNIMEYGPVRGCNVLVDKTGRIDDDAPKKAMTDALTKALSHLGFSADVFLGLFDDNKYVQARMNEEVKLDKGEQDIQWAKKVVARVMTAKDIGELNSLWEKTKPLMETKSGEACEIINATFSTMRIGFTTKGEK